MVRYLPEISSAAFQRVDLGYYLPLLSQPEILHLQLVLKTVDGFGDLSLGPVLQTRLKTCILRLLHTQPQTSSVISSTCVVRQTYSNCWRRVFCS